MKRTLIVLLALSASTAFASELDVPLGARTAIKSKKAIVEIVVRDPSLVTVVDVDGAVSLEGKKSGVTGVTVEYADGELQRMLVVVGEGMNSKGMSAERAQTVDLKKQKSKVASAPVL